MLRLTNCVERVRFDRYTHEQLLRCRREVDMARLRSVLYAVDAGLFGLHLPGIVPHALVLQPNARDRSRAIVREIDSPNQAGDRVGDKDRSRTDQAAAIETANSIGKIQDLLGLDRVTNTPVAQVDAVKAGSVIGVCVRRT
jgi:hypothetical protein